MEDLKHHPLWDFDKRYTNDRILMLKALAVLTPGNGQAKIALFIKLLELKTIMQTLHAPVPENTTACEITDILGDLKEQVSGENKEKIQKMCQMMDSFEMIKQMKDLFDVLGPDMFANMSPMSDDLNANGNAGNMMDILKMFGAM